VSPPEQQKNQHILAGITAQHTGRIPPHLLGLCVVLLLLVIMFADVLFTTSDIVLSDSVNDIALHYVHLRTFGFRELSKGNLPLWNPHIFCGIPYIGGFLSAMFYPPNLIFLVLPLSAAINWCIVLHLFLAGLFTYFWAACRGLSALACTVAAVIVMFCGAVFPHIFAGHLAQLCTMAWAPLLLMSIDGVLNRCSPRWVLVGILAVAMQVLAGFPQYMFYTSLAATLYFLLQLIQVKRRLPPIVAFVTIFAGGAAIASVQLLAGLDANVGSLRQNSVAYIVAGSFSFPPESLLTILAPNFLGSMNDYTYWGVCNLWEMTAFISVTGLVLAVYALVSSKSNYRYVLAALVLITFTLALGSHTPLFRLLYNYAPGFDKFRGTSKFIYLVTLFMLMLTAIGLDDLFRRPHSLRLMSIIAFTAAVLIALAGWSIRHSAQTRVPDGWWADFMLDVRDTADERGERFRPPRDYEDPIFIEKAGHRAAAGLYLTAGICAAVSMLIWARRYSGKIVYAIALLLLVELFLFARPLRTAFSLAEIRSPQFEEFLAKQKGDFRVLNPPYANSGMSTGTYDVDGYDAMILQRYAELTFYAAGQNPDNPAACVTFLKFTIDPLIKRFYQVLRCRFIFYPAEKGVRIITIDRPLERLNLLTDYRIIKDRDAIFKAMSDPSFDPAKTVILESEPACKPAGSVPTGSMNIIDESTDHFTIEGRIDTPAVLLVTDSYHPHWSAVALQGSDQSKYDVLPADYALRAVPLAAGTHRFRMEYRPPLFYIGLWVSLLSLFAYLAASLWFAININRKTQTPKNI
jgi:hypothetical protein